MRDATRNILKLASLMVVLAVLVVGCGPAAGGSGAQEGSLAEDADLEGEEFTVGSKDFTEQLILGQMAVLALESTGAEVTDRTNLAGTEAVRGALESDEVDMYWEYTGTGWITHLGETEPLETSEEQFTATNEADLEENNIRWMEPVAPFDNTYALAMRSEVYDEESEQYDEDLAAVENLSDLETLIEEEPDKATVCVESEFATRDDGLPGMEEAYGYEFPDDNVSQIGTGAVYTATDDGERCNFGEVFESDGRIAALDLQLVEDDESFFPIYNPTMTLKDGLYQEHEEDFNAVFNPISEALDLETMQELNARVDDDGEQPEAVAEDWLQEEGFIG